MHSGLVHVIATHLASVYSYALTTDSMGKSFLHIINTDSLPRDNVNPLLGELLPSHVVDGSIPWSWLCQGAKELFETPSLACSCVSRDFHPAGGGTCWWNKIARSDETFFETLHFNLYIFWFTICLFYMKISQIHFQNGKKIPVYDQKPSVSKNVSNNVLSAKINFPRNQTQFVTSCWWN